MLSFKKYINEVAEPKPEGERNFKKKHTDNIDKKDHPVAKETQFSGGKEKDRSRKADRAKGEDEAVYDRTVVGEETETLDEAKFKKGQKVITLKGPHKGVKHEIIHDFGDGNYNIKPEIMNPKQIKYRLGAAKASASDLKLAEENLDEAKSVRALSDSQLKSFLKKNDSDEPGMSPAFGEQLKQARMELRRRGLKLESKSGSWKKIGKWHKPKDKKDKYGNTIKDKNMAKHLAKKAKEKSSHMGEDVQLDEISGSKLGSYIVKSKKDEKARRTRGIEIRDQIRKSTGMNVTTPYYRKLHGKKNRAIGRSAAMKKLNGIAKVNATEETISESVLSDLQSIVKNKQHKEVKLKNGDTFDVDMTTAGALVKVHDALGGPQRKKFEAALEKNETMFMKMVDFAFSHLK